VPVICASDKTHLTNFSGDKHSWLLFLTIGNIRNDIRRTRTKRTWILVVLMPCPPKGAKKTDKACHSVVGTVLSPLENLDISAPDLKWDYADEFQRQCYPLWLPGSGIIPNKSWLLKSHMAHARCVNFLKVRRWDIQLFDHLITHEINMITWSIWTKLISMFCTLLVLIQSATSSGNTLSAMSIAFGSLMNCISGSWV